MTIRAWAVAVIDRLAGVLVGLASDRGRRLLAGGALLLAACAGPHPRTPSPDAIPGSTSVPDQADASGRASPGHSQTPAIDDGSAFLAAGDVAQIIADDVILRDEPDRAATALDAFRAGERVGITGGPVSAGGYDWYEVRQGPGAAALAPAPLSGWVAAGPNDAPWLARVSNGEIAFTDGASSRAIAAVTPDGSAHRVLIGTPGQGVPHSLQWSPDGSQLLFISAEDPLPAPVRVVPAGGGVPEEIGRGHAAAWSPDGTRVAIAQGDDLVIIDLETRSSEALGLAGISPSSPLAWSPYGLSLAFGAFDVTTSPVVDQPYRLFVIQADAEGSFTTGQVQPITDYGYHGLLGWSPDSSTIAITALTLSAPPALYFVDRDGADARFVAELDPYGPHYGGSPWSPDGTWFLLASDGELRVQPVEGAGHAVARADGDDFLTSAMWSPDGRQIAFVLQSSTGKNRLYVVDAAGNDAPRMVAEDAWAPSWQPLLQTP